MSRHRDISRLEGFSDAVFGFALTLLVVQLETPMTLADLRNTAGSFVPFALTFAMVAWIWHQHNQFFKRYPLDDAWTVFLNSTLLFVVLFYVFPLKSLSLALVGQVTMDPATIPDIREMGQPLVMVIYSAGVVLVFGAFLLLHHRAWQLRRQLGLGVFQLTELRYAVRGHAISAGLGVVSLFLVWLSPQQPHWAGLIYVLMGPLHGWNGYQGGKATSTLGIEHESPGALDLRSTSALERHEER